MVKLEYLQGVKTLVFAVHCVWNSRFGSRNADNFAPLPTDSQVQSDSRRSFQEFPSGAAG